MLISIKDPLSLGEKMEPKSFSSSGLRHHNIYPSWINISLEGPFLKPSKILTSKMPHSKFKAKSCPLNLDLAKCP